MSLARITKQKEELFNRPSTKREITEGKKTETRVKEFYDIVDALARRNSRELIVIDEVKIIPDSFYSPMNFSKRGPVVMLDTFNGNASRLRSERRSELKARIDAQESTDRFKGPYIGWAWKDPDGKTHLVRPSVDVEGHRLHQYAFLQSKIKEKIRVYNSRGSPANTISVEVPSRSTDDTHHVTIEHVPRVRGDAKYVSWTRTASRHDCDAKRNDFTFRWDGRVVTYCPHDVAAYVAYSRQAAAATGEVIPQIFPMFTEPLLRVFQAATYDTMIVEAYEKDGKTRHRSRPLSFPEIDSILMDAWLKEGNKQTFFVRNPKGQYNSGPPIGQRKRMRDYNWFGKDLPGIAFGKE